METHIDALPEEMLEKIFSCLGRKDKASCSKVCKSWEAVGKTVSLWKDEEARVDLDAVSTDVLRNLGERKVGRVRVTRCSRQDALKNLFLAHPNISGLDLEFCVEQPPLNIANEFSVRLPLLKTMTLRLRTIASTEEFMAACSRSFPQLENLGLNQVDNDFTLKDLCKILNSRLRNLKILDLSRTDTYSKAYIRLGDQLPSLCLPDPESQIEHLKVRKANTFTCPTWEWFDQGFPSLKHLQLVTCYLLNFNQLSFLSRLPQLHTLDLDYCSFGDKDVSQPAFCCTSLRCLSIDLDRVVENGVMMRLIYHCFPSLKELEPVHRVFSYAEIMEMAGNLPQLEKLRLQYNTSSLQRRLEEQGLGHLLHKSTRGPQKWFRAKTGILP